MSSLWSGISIPVIGLTGPKESGKTVFASTIAPSETLMIDCELSSASYASIPYKRRVDLFDELAKKGKTSPTPLDAFLAWKEIIDSVKPGEYSVVVTDPWDFIQHGLHDWVEANPGQFGKTDAQYARASGLVWGDLKTWLHMYLGMLAKRLNDGSVVLICHEGQEWKDSRPTAKMKTRGVDTVYQLASLFLNFERKPDQTGKIPQVPAAYTTSTHRGKCRLMHTTMKDGELVTTSILPPRLPQATPKAIRAYIQKPADFGKLKKDELAPEQQMTEQEQLEVRAQIAENERATEEMKLSRAELLSKAGARQPMKNTAPTAKGMASDEQNVVAALGSATVTAQRMQPAPDKSAETATVPASVASPPASTAQQLTEPESKPEASGAQEAPFAPTGPAKPVREVIAEQKARMLTMGVKDDQWLKILGKRAKADGSPCKTIDDLSDDQAEELRKALWDWITKNSSGKS